jgi:hypothetical protein
MHYQNVDFYVQNALKFIRFLYQFPEKSGVILRKPRRPYEKREQIEKASKVMIRRDKDGGKLWLK